ncbi:MAG: ABC transporter permease [Lachnospiraceae bacterium]|nr:ABC transporter permease [Lachnospiraceae bacterium]
MLFYRFLKRNMLLYFRDKTSVFFSFLSTLIVLALMIGFLGENNVTSTLNALGTGQSGAHTYASCLVIIWTIAGIIVVNAVSISMSLVGTMVRDEEEGKMAAFFVAPVKRWVYVTGYVLAAVLVAFLMCVLTFVIGEVYIALIGGHVVTPGEAGWSLLILLAIIFSSAAFVFLCAAFVHTNSAFVGLTTVVGSLIGFLAAIYIPYGGMPKFLRYVIRFLPVFQGASALREVLMERTIAWFDCAPEIKSGYADYMGLVIQFGDHTLSSMEKVLYMLAAGLGLLVVATMVLSHKKQTDR